MTSVNGSDNLVWSDEQTRLYLQLRIDEDLKGNVKNKVVNDTGRRTIIEKYYETYGEKLPWRKFGIKHNTCKKQYDSFKRLIHKRSGLGYDPRGFLEMSDSWWNDRCKEWPGALKLKEKPVANMDLMEQVFGSTVVSGAEGWTAQQGEEQLDSMVPEEEGINEFDATSESRINIRFPTQQTDGPAASNGHAPSNGPASSHKPKTNRKRSRAVQAGQAVADVIKESIQSCDQILSHKNQLIENHPEFSCTQLRAMQALHSLPAIRMWSPLYKASILHLKENPANRQTFLCYEDDENKIKYLEFATAETRDA